MDWADDPEPKTAMLPYFWGSTCVRLEDDFYRRLTEHCAFSTPKKNKVTMVKF